MSRIEENKTQFIEIISNTNIEGIPELIDYLESTDFFTAPASSKYHGSFEGGLCEHSLNVYYEAIALNKFYQLGLPESSLVLTSLCHDLCKINMYKKTTVNVPPNRTKSGKWEQQPGYIRQPETLMGHGALSVSTLQDYVKISKEEKQAIFWHMGACDLGQYNQIGDMSIVFEQNQLAFIIHQADMVATYIAENESIQWDD